MKRKYRGENNGGEAKAYRHERKYLNITIGIINIWPGGEEMSASISKAGMSASAIRCVKLS
jgi:hypothetical protein